MKQQINLYLPELRIKADFMTMAMMLQIISVVAVLMFLVSGYGLTRNYFLQSELDTLRGQLVEETRKTNEIDQVLTGRTQNVELGNQLRTAESDLEASRQMHSFFGQSALGNANGFSEYFKDISRATVDGLWITNFSFRNGGNGVQLKGFTIDSSLVPAYVANLGQGRSTLVNSQFGVTTSRAPDIEELFSFELNSSP